MKRLLIALMALSFVAALATGPAMAKSIRVLVMDGAFSVVPDKDEQLSRLGKMKGRLLVSDASYIGDIEVWKGQKGLYLINELPFEDYVKNVVKAETAEDWHLEALKAQAVVSRTYALKHMAKGGDGNFDLTSSTLHQVYKGENEDDIVSKAVDETRGQILTYKGKPIEALYHSTCGGETEDDKDVFGFDFPYLVPVKAACNLSPYHMWARRIPLAEIEGATGTEGVTGLKVTKLTSTGRAAEVEIENSGEPVTMKATDLRKALGWKRLPSTAFAVEVEGGDALFEGRGYGHGVGMCQWSSLEMARGGMGYKEMLSTYYPGTELSNYEDLGL